MVIDSIDRNCEWVKKSLKRTSDIVNGDNSGRMQGNKSMFLDYVGTFFNYKGQICRTKNCTDAEWEQIFLQLSSPINRHTIGFPFGQGTLTQEVYISQVESTLIEKKDDYKWDNVYDVTFVAINSQWLAGQSGVIGYSD